MIVTIASWLYISLLCWGWGDFILEYSCGRTKKKDFDVPVVVLTGLTAIAVLCGYFSLLMPLGNILPHAILLPVASFQILRSIRRSARNVTPSRNFLKTNLPIAVFFISALSLILFTGTWYITHPDTIGYHAPIIYWLEKYKVVPGLVHLNRRYGLQSSWFELCALFSFRFLQSSALTFVNTTVLVWFFGFLVQRILKKPSASGKSHIDLILIFLLLALTSGYFMLVRLTALSASPDFISAIYIWLVIYLFLTEKNLWQVQSLAFLFAFFSITLKLSALPLLGFCLVIGYRLFTAGKFKRLISLCFLSIVIVTPFLIRNVETSGYPFFPSTVADIANVDWKYDQEQANQITQYVKAYARDPSITSENDITRVANETMIDWCPRWWQKLAIAEKIILLGTALAFIFLATTKTIFRVRRETQIVLILLTVSILFWFITAPAVRFGVGFLTAFIGIVLYEVLHAFFKTFQFKQWQIAGILGCLSLLFFAYSTYRYVRFFEPKQLIKPLGISKAPYQKIECKGLWFYTPTASGDCGSIPNPCTLNCETFQPRGASIEDGFRIAGKK